MQNKQLLINEIFFSLQGEGIHAGVPTVFIRMQGCSLRCSYCDTKYAMSSDPEMGSSMTVEECMEKVRAIAKCKHVCITGGEPLEQDPVLLMQLLVLLIEAGYYITVETGGHKSLQLLVRLFTGEPIHFCVDYKLPSSGMMGMMVDEAFLPLRQHESIKYVIGGNKDWMHAIDHLTWVRNQHIQATALFSPVWGETVSQELAEKVKKIEGELGPGRLSLQIHKIIWPAEKRGV